MINAINEETNETNWLGVGDQGPLDIIIARDSHLEGLAFETSGKIMSQLCRRLREYIPKREQGQPYPKHSKYNHSVWVAPFLSQLQSRNYSTRKVLSSLYPPQLLSLLTFLPELLFLYLSFKCSPHSFIYIYILLFISVLKVVHSRWHHMFQSLSLISKSNMHMPLNFSTWMSR